MMSVTLEQQLRPTAAPNRTLLLVHVSTAKTTSEGSLVSKLSTA
jgi:hypothetical protein